MGRFGRFFADNLSVGLATRNTFGMGLGQALLACVMMCLGIRALIYDDFASVWQRVPTEHLPARQFFVYGCAIVELAAGIGLLTKRTAASSFILSVYLLLWAVLLKVPAVLHMPRVEATWLGLGEITVILAGAWILFATHAEGWARNPLKWVVGINGVGCARLLLVLSLPAIGLSHWVYTKETAEFVPAWLPWPYGWARLTGAGSIAAGFGILFGVCPRLAATLEAAMLSVITLLVWLPGLIAAPGDEPWTAFLMSSAIACGAWVVADSYRGAAWLGIEAAKSPKVS